MSDLINFKVLFDLIFNSLFEEFFISSCLFSALLVDLFHLFINSLLCFALSSIVVPLLT
jgi:hypothetical protein